LQVLDRHTSQLDFDTIYERVSSFDTDFIEWLQGLIAQGYVVEPREWHYTITEAGSKALAYATYDVEADPVGMIYAGLGVH